MRHLKTIPLKNSTAFKKKLFDWSQQFKDIAWLDSNEYPRKYSNYDTILAVDSYSSLHCNYTKAFSKLKAYKNKTKDYIFGYLSYDLKNDIENISSSNFDGLHFPDLHFFQPKKLFLIKGNILKILYIDAFSNEMDMDLNAILNQKINRPKIKSPNIEIHKRITKNEYLKQLKIILEHIHKGDIYEVNFCQEFYAENAIIDPFEVYLSLNKISKSPLASFLKFKDKYLLSASPERFIKKEKNKIISQPIKGTAKRLSNKVADKKIAQKLLEDPKERAENIMIVDMVRNDLSKTASKGSVQVEELCKIYSFKQVHQLISTITSLVHTNTDSVEILKSMFPMGSMTGAPKLSAMQIIEKTEATKRGLYSGAVGYFTPTDDFDFNVVIRSILYNPTEKYISYSVGGAITAKSNPQKEYEECLIKAIAMKKALIAKL